jgi:hypothetical protein
MLAKTGSSGVESELWIGLVEARPPEQKAYGAAGTFTHIVTWAEDVAGFREKAETVLSTLNLYVIGIEGALPLAKWLEKRSPSEEIEDMIRRAEFNPNAIVWGTFHRYRFDES